MEEFRDIRDLADGNTNSSAKSKQPLQYKSHFFTWNNYSEDHIEILEQTFKSICSWYCFQKEKGKNGTPHLQGVIGLKKKMRWTEFELPKQIHWEKTRNIDKAIDYCQKLDTAQGDCYKYGLKEPLKHFVMWNSWNLQLLDTILDTPDKRKINWIWSSKGKMGKTSFTRYLVDKHNAQFCNGGKYTDIMNLIYHTDMDECSCVIFSLPREHKNHISYSALESVKDGMVCNMKSYKNGSKIFNPPHIIVFANYPPEKEYLSLDRWNIIRLDYMFRDV